ncbi:MAG: glycosyltransferase family 4 protein [Planctomycetes bacterium]|nr:glycosyltransferase family 4 protein [Planctomycetota bacterium]
MNLLYVLHQFLPRHVTGTEQYVRSLALGLRERGHDVRVFAVEPQVHLLTPGRTWIETDEEVDGIPVRRVGVHDEVLGNRELCDYRNPLATALLRRFLEQWPADLAHVFHLRNLGAGAIDEAKRQRRGVVVNLMDFWFLCPRFTLLRHDGALCDGPPEGGLGCVDCADPGLGPPVIRRGVGQPLRALVAGGRAPLDFSGRPLRRAAAQIGRKERLLQALRRADRVLSPSRFLRARFEEHGFPAGVIRLCPYGVDPKRLGGRTRRPPQGACAPLVLGFVGSLTPHKGLHVLIEAVRRIAGGSWRLHVHGSLDVHPEYARGLLQRAGGDERIAFRGEFQPTELGSVLAGIDLLVVPSLWYENTPFTVLEARMMGLPLLASDLGGISEVVEEGRNGFLFPAGDAAALERRLRAILASPACLAALECGAAVRTLDQNLDDFEALYAEVLARR